MYICLKNMIDIIGKLGNKDITNSFNTKLSNLIKEASKEKMEASIIALLENVAKINDELGLEYEIYLENHCL